MGKELYKGALEKLDTAIYERIKYFKALVQKLPKSVEIYQEIKKEKASKQLISQKRELSNKWSEIEDIFNAFKENEMESTEKMLFLEKIDTAKERKGNDYIRVIQGLDKKWRETGSKWLKSIVDRINEEVLEIIPSFKIVSNPYGAFWDHLYDTSNLQWAYELGEVALETTNSEENQEMYQMIIDTQASILQVWGRLEDAMNLHKKQEEICQKLGDLNSLQRSYGNQALILKDWGRLEEAMNLLKKQEEI